MPAEPLGSAPATPTIAARALLASVRIYQLVFSPLYAGSCRFVPSCSHYATEAILRFGALRGAALAVRRLMRCHPFGSHGMDPVPDGASSGLPSGEHAESHRRS